MRLFLSGIRRTDSRAIRSFPPAVIFYPAQSCKGRGGCRVFVGTWAYGLAGDATACGVTHASRGGGIGGAVARRNATYRPVKASPMLTQASRPATCEGVRAQSSAAAKRPPLQKLRASTISQNARGPDKEHTTFALTGIGSGTLTRTKCSVLLSTCQRAIRRHASRRSS